MRAPATFPDEPEPEHPKPLATWSPPTGPVRVITQVDLISVTAFGEFAFTIVSESNPRDGR